MGKTKIQEIKTIVAPLSEVDSKNEQKVVAVVSWNGREDTLDIRKYNVKDEILLKGIALNPEEVEELIYVLLATKEVEYDADKAKEIIDNRTAAILNVEEIAGDLIDEEAVIEGSEDNIEHRTIVSGLNGYMRIVRKR